MFTVQKNAHVNMSRVMHVMSYAWLPRLILQGLVHLFRWIGLVITLMHVKDSLEARGDTD